MFSGPLRVCALNNGNCTENMVWGGQRPSSPMHKHMCTLTGNTKKRIRRKGKAELWIPWKILHGAPQNRWETLPASCAMVVSKASAGRPCWDRTLSGWQTASGHVMTTADWLVQDLNLKQKLNISLSFMLFNFSLHIIAAAQLLLSTNNAEINKRTTKSINM